LTRKEKVMNELSDTMDQVRAMHDVEVRKPLKNRIALLEAKVKKLRQGIDVVGVLIENSNGVYGLHLNGDNAPWDELLARGRFEEWLKDLSEVL